MRRFRNVLATALAAGLSSGVAGQQAAHDSPVSPVHTVRVDAIVTDARGGIVGTLAARDFELREDGSLVTIEEAQFLKNSPRLVAIYLDEYHISAGASADRARDALTEFVDRDLDPRDFVVVMKPLDSLLTIRLTHDMANARRIVTGLEGRKGDYAPRTTYERNFMTGSPARIETARTQVAVSALQALSEHLGSLSDLHKTLVIVSEGLNPPPRRRGQEYLATIDSVVRSANRAKVSIYPVDPRPATAAAPAATDVLRALASDTNGRLIANADDVSAGMRRVATDANAFYMLTYRNAHKEDGAFHPVQVRVKRAGVEVRARSGYWAPSADDRLRAELIADASRPPVVIPPEPATHTSPLIRPWFGWSLGTDGKTRVTFVWEPSVVVPGDRGRLTPARLELTVLDASDAVLFKGPVLPTGPGMVEEPGGEPARAVFDAAPGRLRLRMKIEDATHQAVDSDVRAIAVTDLRGPVSIGTPAILRARNAREFRTLDHDPAAVPVSSREFSRTERLLIRFPAYASNGQRPSVSAKLMTWLGQPMRDLEVEPVADGENQIDIPLAGFAAGEYLIELTAKGAVGQARSLVQFRITS